jgi:hypothetical protein
MRRLVPPTSPEVWGPPTWVCLHRLAAGYPDDPTPPVKKHCAAFLTALPWMLPCESCGFHIREFTLAYAGGVKRAASCRPELVEFLLAAHNDVAARTRPAAAPWTAADAKKAYGSSVETDAQREPPLEWVDGAGLIRSLNLRGCGCSA